MSALDRRCDDVLSLMTAYLEEELPTDERLTLETHVVYCPGCYGFMAQVRATAAVLRTLPIEPIPATVRRELEEAFRTAAGGVLRP